MPQQLPCLSQPWKFAKDTKSNKEVVLFDFIRNILCQSKSFGVANRPAIPI